jgi:dihydrodipicolinate synthase/N-acetylneuraminate lyase
LRSLTAEDCTDVLVVAITPRTPTGEVDLQGIRDNVSHLVASGVRFLMPMCGTGLVYDATLDEFEQVTSAFLESAGDALVVPGIGPGFGRSLEMARIAAGLGVAGAMVMPIVGPASAAGTSEGLRRISDTAGMPVILYQRRLDIMPVASVVRLCTELDGVVGLKYAVDDIDSFRRIVTGAGKACAMVCGMAEDPSIDYLQADAVGFSSGMANFVPRMSLALLQAFRVGDLKEAERLRSLMVPFEDFRGENGARYSGSALHAAMEVAGLAGGPVIPFAEDVAAADMPRVRQMLEGLLAEEQRLCDDVDGIEGGRKS